MNIIPFLKTAGFLFWKNKTFIFVCAAILSLVLTSRSCVSNKQQKDKLTIEVQKKDSLIAVLEKQNEKYKADIDTCKAEQSRIAVAYDKAKSNYVQKTQDFREATSKLSTAQKQVKLLKIAKEVVEVQQSEETGISLTDTVFIKDSVLLPLGTVKIGSKDLPYYTEEQQDLILWAISQGQIMQKDHKDALAAKAYYDTILNSIGSKTINPIEEEIHSRHFLGIGQKKALKELKAELLETFNKYNIKVK